MYSNYTIPRHFCHQEPLIWNLVLSLLHQCFKNISWRVWRQYWSIRQWRQCTPIWGRRLETGRRSESYIYFLNKYSILCRIIYAAPPRYNWNIVGYSSMQPETQYSVILLFRLTITNPQKNEKMIIVDKIRMIQIILKITNLV